MKDLAIQAQKLGFEILGLKENIDNIIYCDDINNITCVKEITGGTYSIDQAGCVEDPCQLTEISYEQGQLDALTCNEPPCTCTV